MSNFKVKFDILDYKKKGILPDISEYLKHDEIINADQFEKGNIDNCIWVKKKPTEKELSSPSFREREITRILKTGAWICIKDQILWLPPSYYTSLKYGQAGDDDLQFRLKRLKQIYFKIEARSNPGCKGTFTIKNRQDGETTISLQEAFQETFDGGQMNIGQIGIQSKTREDAKNPCWTVVQNFWNGLDQWLKDELCSDFISGDSIAEKIEFRRSKDEYEQKEARNILIKYYPAVFNAMDGKNGMRKCILDEVLKWVECEFLDTLINYSKFIMPGFERKGLFDIFSSPADKPCKSYEQGYELWKDSDPTQIDPETGTTKSRIHRYYSNPLEGIQGAYDKWGDADPDLIYAHIMRERKNTAKDKLLGEIRGFPLTNEEMWGSVEGAKVWSNTKGLTERSLYLVGNKYKNKETLEPARVYGNLERVDGYIDGEVEFRQADIDHFDKEIARFCFSYLPRPDHKEPLTDIFNPPAYVENCLGVDPFNLRYRAKNSSKESEGAMVNRKFRDIHETGIVKIPTMIYWCRPWHQDVFFEDVIKAAIFNRALIQYENRSDKLANYAEDRGYFNWLLPEIGADAQSKRKGDAPSGQGKFLDEGMGLLDAAINKPINPNDPYRLLEYWFPELIDDYLKFNPQDTHANDLTMADIQSLIGCVKILKTKKRQESDVNDAVLNYLFA